MKTRREFWRPEIAVRDLHRRTFVKTVACGLLAAVPFRAGAQDTAEQAIPKAVLISMLPKELRLPGALCVGARGRV